MCILRDSKWKTCSSQKNSTARFGRVYSKLGRDCNETIRPRERCETSSRRRKRRFQVGYPYTVDNTNLVISVCIKHIHSLQTDFSYWSCARPLSTIISEEDTWQTCPPIAKLYIKWPVGYSTFTPKVSSIETSSRRTC